MNKEKINHTFESLNPNFTIQTFIPTYSNETIKISNNDLLANTSIFAISIDGEITDVINIKTSN